MTADIGKPVRPCRRPVWYAAKANRTSPLEQGSGEDIRLAFLMLKESVMLRVLIACSGAALLAAIAVAQTTAPDGAAPPAGASPAMNQPAMPAAPAPTADQTGAAGDTSAAAPAPAATSDATTGASADTAAPATDSGSKPKKKHRQH